MRKCRRVLIMTEFAMRIDDWNSRRLGCILRPLGEVECLGVYISPNIFACFYTCEDTPRHSKKYKDHSIEFHWLIQSSD